jgi:acyl dehydratase
MTFDLPPDDRYFEDYLPGSVHEFGSISVEERDVIEFGKRYVPLSYHVDKEPARKSIYGGLIASGWQPRH